MPETVQAIRAAMADRPDPKDSADAGLVFLTKRGYSWTKDIADSPITKEMRKILDRLTINVEWASEPAGTAAEEAAANTLAHHVKSSVGISVDVRILAPNTLERSVGKARRVIDRRQRD